MKSQKRIIINSGTYLSHAQALVDFAAILWAGAPTGPGRAKPGHFLSVSPAGRAGPGLVSPGKPGGPGLGRACKKAQARRAGLDGLQG